MADTDEITVVGGGVAGLAAAIVCAEGGAPVRLLEARGQLGGRARSDDGPYKTNFGPHALYANGTLHAFLAERGLLPPLVKPPLTRVYFHAEGRRRATPPPPFATAVVKLWRVKRAPVDRSFRDWASERVGARAAEQLCGSAGVFCFFHDPGALSAAFVWERWRQAFGDQPTKARFPRGGWNAIVGRMERHAREHGAQIETGARVTSAPRAPAIVATELKDARALLHDDALDHPGGLAVGLDLGLTSRRGDPFVVWDLDQAGWVERFSTRDRSLAPAGEELVQAQIGIRPGESTEQAEQRLETLLDHALGDDWRARTRFRRRTRFEDRSGALDLPGVSWRDRPAVERGDGIFLAGDHVAAPGLLSDASIASARAAAAGALAWRGERGSGAQAGLRAEISRL
ncbi:FAD-dependent oxidoreductase [Conexibacter sp. JD483]|uniref:FAD-dependent oxidoreductase n=1 Tax=unclassified Conexibacter TaxID=2627773 RepID=UPI0027213EC9|nr:MULTISPECIES: FAD-dependent oxidoreductase [unclassified Conexibacter]MDO8186729.1 FAD-dependent oxidoreductase [Conexibacter sp. CPCC 205706]MDO8199015.1 FAD-dependent oxidoreductase [Conexibacter sp. CPCC 205762]MDR9368467.1 FAD-dependent oxidoreductase [Conexibacter sp. JD483]